MEDGAIIQLFESRDERAISASMAKYGQNCYALARNILGNHEDAVECVDDAFLGIWNSIPPQNPSSLKAYALKLTRNASLNRAKKESAQKRGSGQYQQVMDELKLVLPGGDDPLSILEAREAASAVNAFVAALPADKRTLFVRRYWFADSVRDIARRCGMSERRVSVILHRIRKDLQEYLRGEGIR